MSNNPVLYNAALSGFTAGVYLLSPDMGTLTATFASIAATAAQFASVIDSSIQPDPSITPVSTPPSSASSAGTSAPAVASPVAAGKAQLLFAICLAKTRTLNIGESLPDSPPNLASTQLINDVLSAYAAAQSQVVGL